MKLFKRLFCFLICIVMIITLTPLQTLADYEDAEECEYCGHYHWGDYICDGCGCCSSECTNDDCYDAIHCGFCGTCLLEASDYCYESRFCDECLQQEGYHCVDCNECYCLEDGEPLCGNCFRCELCAPQCPDCGWCYECGEHCDICEACWPEMCDDGGTHCKECCEDMEFICEECGRCTEALDLGKCEECGLCFECCEYNSCPDCGMCKESAEYDSHLCDECGVCLNTVDVCGNCGLCMDCCLALAESEGCECGEICWMEITDAHICQDCGHCIEDCGGCGAVGNESDIDECCIALGGTEACESCAFAGEYRCLACCEKYSELMGCDCDEKVCVNSPEWETHMALFHNKTDDTHEMIPQNSWTYDAENHWHACRLCDDDSHISSKSGHVFNEQGKCKICGYSSSDSIVIISQPKDTVVGVNDESAIANDGMNKAVFVVSALGKDGKKGLHYEWYYTVEAAHDISFKVSLSEDTVADDNGRLEALVPSDGCYSSYEYFCVVSDDYGNSVTSSKAKLICKHQYYYESCNNMGYFNGEKILNKCERDEDGHILLCAGAGCDEFSKKLPHTYSEWKWEYDADGNRVKRTRTCSDCGYVQEYKAHNHEYNMESLGEMIGLGDNVNRVEENGEFKSVEGIVSDVNTGKKITIGYDKNSHYVECAQKGCELIHKEKHVWGKWQISGDELDEGAGAIYRECNICGYQDCEVKTDQNGNEILWEFGVHPINPVNCEASISFAKKDQRVHLVPNKIEDKTFEKYVVTVDTVTQKGRHKFDIHYEKGETKDITDCVENDVLTVPNVKGKGVITVEAVYKDGCEHASTEVVNQVEPTCTKMGYTGDTVCATCGKLIARGQDINELGHEESVPATNAVEKMDASGKTVYVKYKDGKLYKAYLVLPKIDNVICGEESEFYSNYTCDEICPRCGIVTKKGRYVDKNHKYESRVIKEANCYETGLTESECTVCHKITSSVTNREHKNIELRNEKVASCEQKGYTGDVYCKDCGELVKKGTSIAKLNHEWGDGAVISEVQDRKYVLHKCKNCATSYTESIDKDSENKNSEDNKKDDEKSMDNKSDENKDADNKADDNKKQDANPEDNKSENEELIINDTESHFVINKDYVVKTKVDINSLVDECMKSIGKDAGDVNSYKLSDKKMASLNSKGILSLKKKGTLTITGLNKSGNGKKSQMTEVCSITLNIVDVDIDKKVDINYMDEEIKLSENIKNNPRKQKIEFSQSDKSKKYGKITSDGIFKPVKDGKVKVKCTVGEGIESITYTIVINIKTPSINIKEGQKIKNGKIKKIQLKNLPKTAIGKVSWNVSDPEKAEIKSSGDKFIKIKAIDKGEVQINVNVDGHELQKKISIK